MMGEKTGSKAKRDSRDLTGRQFGKLKVMERLSERESRYVVYLCRCECGNEVRVSSKNCSGEQREAVRTAVR